MAGKRVLAVGGRLQVLSIQVTTQGSLSVLVTWWLLPPE